MTETEEESKDKFIALMRNLIEQINENPAHQLTIYECLNTQQIKRLFESLHDYSKILRLTALLFITKLLFNSPHIVDTILTRDNCDLTGKKNSTSGATTTPIQKYIITGLHNYNLDNHKLAEIVSVLNTKVKYRKNCLFWYIDLESIAVHYFDADGNVEASDIDPRNNVIGIFVGDSDSNSTTKTISNNPSTSLIRKNHGIEAKTKYTIAKNGQFSFTKKN